MSSGSLWADVSSEGSTSRDVLGGAGCSLSGRDASGVGERACGASDEREQFKPVAATANTSRDHAKVRIGTRGVVQPRQGVAQRLQRNPGVLPSWVDERTRF